MARPRARSPHLSARLIVLVVAAALLALLAAPAGAAAMPAWGGVEPGPATAQDYHDAVARLIAEGYPQGVVDHLCSLGTMGMGMRTAGDPADDAGAMYIAEQLTAMGLSNVRLEPVPVDEWTFHGASVTVHGGETGDGSETVGGVATTSRCRPRPGSTSSPRRRRASRRRSCTPAGARPRSSTPWARARSKASSSSST